MSRSVCLGWLVTAGAGWLGAATLTPVNCTDLQTLADLIQNGECAIGVYTIKNPAFASTGPGALGPDQIGVIANGRPVKAGEFTFDLAAALIGPDTEIATFYHFGFTIDPPPPVLKDVSFDGGFEDFRAGLEGPTVLISIMLCGGAFFDGTMCPGEFHELILSNETTLSGRIVLDRPTNIIDIRQDIVLHSGGQLGGGLRMTVGATPEPSTWALALLGGALLAFWRRR